MSLILLTLITAASVAAQSQDNVAGVPFSKAPYRIGERLTYSVKFGPFPSAAHVELWVAAHGMYFNRDGVQLRAHVETTGVVNAALYSIDNDYITYVTPENGMPYRVQQFRREAGGNETTLREYNTSEAGASVSSKNEVFLGTFDFLSALYRIRALPLGEGGRYSFSINDGDYTYDAELKIKGRELIKTAAGSFTTIVTQFKFPHDSALDDLELQIYFSDDSRHVPVLLTGKLATGTVRAELAGSELPGATPAPVDPASPDMAASQMQVQPAPNPNAVPPGNIPGIPGIPMNPGSASPGGSGVSPPVSPETPKTSSPAKPNSGLSPPLAGSAAKTSTALPPGLPFAAGEQLNFNIYLENVAQPVGLASFQVRARSKYHGRDGLMLTGKAQTVGTAQSLFVADDQITTYVDPTTLLPYRFEMSLQESRRKSSQTVVIDQNRGSAMLDPVTKLEIPVGTYDLLSAFYALRSFNLKSPKPNAVSLLVNNRARTLFITFIKRETIELGGQQIPSLQLSLTTDDAQPDRNGLRLWVTEDQRRLPLRLTVVTPAGRVRADLAILPIVRQ